MGLLSKAISKSSVNPVVRGSGYELSRGWGGGVLDHYRRNDYENAYPSIRVISQRFARIEPFTIDKTGKSVSSNVLDRLYTPNKQMSAYDFRLALAVMCLVHNKVYVRVHHRTTRITAETITGFTFLEGVSEHIVNGAIEYWLPNAEKLTPAEVAVFRSPNPYDLNDGFSPAFAARRWTGLDDLIADYQTGYFTNGAVPSGQFIVTAKTTTDYQDIVKGIKKHHQGAGKNNSVMFAHRPLGVDGKPLDSQIEWIPFSSTNKEMALKDLFEQANKKIDSTYGVPASLRGVNDANTYASVRVDTLIFNENTLDPFALNVWQKLTHELNRITGGLGVAITYDLETPLLADEEKVKAEAKKLDAETITHLTDAGYTLDSAIAYVKTGDVQTLKQVPKPDEKAEVLSSEEAKHTPDQPVDLTHRPKAKALSDKDRADYETQLEGVIYERMAAQIEAASSLVSSKALSDDEPVEPEEDALLAAAMLAVLLALISAQGPLEHADNLKLVFEAGINTDNVSPFQMTGAQEAEYRAYVEKVGASYNQQTAERIRNILVTGREQGLSAGEVKAQLKGLLDEEWRIKRIATTEINKAGNEASQFSMENIAKETGADVRKVWTHSGGDDPCEFCLTMIGTEIGLDQDFIPIGESVQGADGGVRVNDFTPVRTPGFHPHCHCRPTYVVVR